MEIKLGTDVLESIQFLWKLEDEELIGWPIDFETSRPARPQLIGMESNPRKVELETFDASSWFENSIEEYEKHKFYEFGIDGTGSGFCLWYYPDLNKIPPVVFWGSDGEFHFVAGSIQDFIKQLSSGKLFFSGSWLEPEDDEIEELDWNKLRSVTESHLGKWVEKPEELTVKGRLDHPDFEGWVNENWE